MAIVGINQKTLDNFSSFSKKQILLGVKDPKMGDMFFFFLNFH